MMEICPDFQSAVSKIESASDVHNHLREALDNQHLFEKRFINPSERKKIDINNFTIQPDNINRLYYLETFMSDTGKDFELIARIESTYVHLNASCDNTGFECQGMGTILVGIDPNFFMKSVLVKINNDREAIYKLLEKDSIFIKNEIETIIERERLKMCTSLATLTFDEYVRYPITQDIPSINYVRKNKLMVIMKGLPGSGKSSVTRVLQKIYPDAIICSVDHYFAREGEYKFQFDQLEQAHKACQKKARRAAKRNCHVIIIDNTNVRHWESKVYLRMARDYNYLVLYIEPQTPWRFDVETLAKHNIHGVKKNILQQKLTSYQELHPLYYGWFFNEADSEGIIKTGREWFKLALSTIIHCLTYFKRVTGQETIDEIIDYFTNNNNNSMLHVTAKYIGRKNKKTIGPIDYIKNSKESMGKVSIINNIGYVITPYTFGARVQLTDEQLELWGVDDDDENRPDNIFETEQNKKDEKNMGNNDNDGNGDDDDIIFQICKQNLKFINQISYENNNNNNNRFWPTSGRGSRAHITLGYAPRVKPLITGFDLINVIKSEQNCKEYSNMNVLTYNISNAMVKFYENGSWVIYPENKLTAEAMFSAYY